MTIIDSAFIQLQVLEGRNLVPKNRRFLFGKKRTSNPYVKISWNGQPLNCNQTQVQTKTLNPIWNHKTTIQVPPTEIGKLMKGRPEPIILDICNWHDKGSNDNDPMGTVLVPIHITENIEQNIERKWLPVTTGIEGSNLYCHKATGDVCVSLTITITKLMHLKPGNRLPLKCSQIMVGLAWEPELSSTKIDLDISCVALSNTGQILMDDTVYYGNTSNSNQSIWHSGDETTGKSSGDNERIHFDLNQIPQNIAALYLLVNVATPRLSLAQVKSAQIRFYRSTTANAHQHQQLKSFCGLAPAQLGDYTNLIVARLASDTGNVEQWNLCPILVGTSPSRDFGALVPQIKSYSRDIVPNVKVDPSERLVIMRKNGVVRLRDFCRNQLLPKTVSFGLAWDVTDGKSIDLDASVICLDKYLQKVDLVYYNQLCSHDGSIQHSGDEQEGDKVGDDETINIQLQNVASDTAYIGILVNSFSCQELDVVARTSCHLYDTESKTDIALYQLTGNKALHSYTALVMGCLYRNVKEDWMLQIISEPAQGRTPRENVDDLQRFLKRNPVPMEPTIMIEAEEEEIDLSMPAAVNNNEEEEIAVVPMA